jgi:hypothetical protein
MKTVTSMLAASILALSLSACSHVGPSDAEASQAFQNFGWARAGLPESAKDKIRAKDCNSDAHDSSIYVCQITVDGFAGSKASIPFRKIRMEAGL